LVGKGHDLVTFKQKLFQASLGQGLGTGAGLEPRWPKPRPKGSWLFLDLLFLFIKGHYYFLSFNFYINYSH
jgi:hypothetical protein